MDQPEQPNQAHLADRFSAVNLAHKIRAVQMEKAQYFTNQAEQGIDTKMAALAARVPRA